jgi:lipoprotein LpqB-like beta-propeller protein/sporulation and spore germination protein
MVRRRPQLRWLVVALTALATVAGCADVPASGPLQSTKLPAAVGGQQGNPCCAQIMSPPQPGWGPVTIVQNFILASAEYTNDHAIAREYLTTAANSAWQPGPGPAVTVIASTPNVSSVLPPQLNSPKTAIVEITAKKLGAVNSTGQFTPAPDGQATLNQSFGLRQVNGQWRIDRLPAQGGKVSRELLLSKDFFQLAYQPRNLYYFDPYYKNLVPDPVFLPVNTADPATVLVDALLADPQGWLEGAAYSEFPAGSHAVRVQIPPGSKTAIVDLRMPRSAATRSSLAEMSAQLVWTLTSTSYGSRTIQAVKLEVNGRAWTPPGSASAVQDRTDYPQPCLQPPGHQSLYFLTSSGAARVLTGHGTASAPVPGQAGTSQIPLTSIAISPGQHYLAGTSPSAGGTLYTADLAAAAQPRASQSARNLHVRLTGLKVSAASWDAQNELWVAGTLHGRLAVRMFPGKGGAPVTVTLPAGIQQIIALRVAPDGVRVALIVTTKAGPRVLLAAVVRSADQITLASAGQLGADLADPTALSWYDADHLLVVDQADIGPELFEVPVNGDRSTFQSVEPGMISITAAGPHNSLYASLQTGLLARSVGLGELWSTPVTGRGATYPG